MNTEKETYNGWSNYATWRVNLEMVDVGDLDGETFASIYNLADNIRENVENYIETECDNGREGVNFAHSYALAFLSDVNWYEIAQRVAENYPLILESNAKCHECDKVIDLDTGAYYPYTKYDDDMVQGHELCDTPFCNDCANKELEKNKKHD